MYRSWKPKAWIAILLGIILQSVTFLYVNRAAWFVFYLLSSLVLGCVDLIYGTFSAAVLSLICPIHAYFITRNYDTFDERSWYSKWWGILLSLLLLVASLFTLRAFFYEPFSIPSKAMNPTLGTGNYIIVSKFPYRTYGTLGLSLYEGDLASPSLMQRGKMYVFKYPKDNSITYIKRLVGLPGDRIEVRYGDVTVNDVAVKQALVKEATRTKYYSQTLDGNSFYIQRNANGLNASRGDGVFIIPEKSYFFLGDNRDNSNDSRYWGVVPSHHIVGEVVYTIKPK
ncbi:signal peptidase I [Leucothrix sargassi]|nr:signal peptidase I [Leucothrix sargassi]